MQTVYQSGAPIHSSMNVRGRPQLSDEDSIYGRSAQIVMLVGYDAYEGRELREILKALDIEVINFGSAREYLEHVREHEPSCTILHFQLPEMNGLELQQHLGAGRNPPIIFISGPCDVSAAVTAMKGGAVDFLVEPIDLFALLSAVQVALFHDRKRRRKVAELAKLQSRFILLTPREKEVLPLIASGLLNKQAAFILGISIVTLQIHRSQIMRKMQADSFADLVRMAIKLRISHRREDRSPSVNLPNTSLRGVQPNAYANRSVDTCR